MARTLHDGLHNVEKIGVMLWYRNNESYIRDFVKPFFSRVEKLYPAVSFKYFILENDSTDNTRQELIEFMENRAGVLLAEDLNLPDNNTGISFHRIHRIAYVRNYLLNRVRDELTDCQWVLCLDSDVYIDELNIQYMLDKAPKKHNIGMLTINGVVVHSSAEQTVKDEDDWVQYAPDDASSKEDDTMTMLHYYDTFAFVDKDDISYHPFCASSQCISPHCNTHIPPRIDFTGVFEVRAAWGGCVLIDASVFMNSNIMWKTIRLSNEAICEHVYMCDSMRLCTGKKVVVCGDVFAYYHQIMC